MWHFYPCMYGLVINGLAEKPIPMRTSSSSWLLCLLPIVVLLTLGSSPVDCRTKLAKKCLEVLAMTLVQAQVMLMLVVYDELLQEASGGWAHWHERCGGRC